VKVFYDIDDSPVWSERVCYPLGEREIVVFGPHKIVFRFEDQAGRIEENVLRYTVNSPRELALVGGGERSIDLPISVEELYH
jgi:hypothetical protein